MKATSPIGRSRAFASDAGQANSAAVGVLVLVLVFAVLVSSGTVALVTHALSPLVATTGAG